MSDEKRGEGSVASAGGKTAATEIAYCPHLRVYNYLRADGDQFIFDDAQLERSINSYLRSGDERQAEFMATLTGMARQFPHQIVSFDAEGKLNLQALLAAEIPRAQDEVSPGEQQSSLPEAGQGQAAGRVLGPRDPSSK